MANSAPKRQRECVRAFEHELDYVQRTLRRQGVAPADVDDLSQEVFMVVWRRWAEFDQRRPVRPWLAGIAFNVVGTFLRRSRREVPRADLETMDPAPHGEDGLAAMRARQVIVRALAQMPDAYRTVLVLRDIEGVPMRQIASEQGVPLFTAYTRLRRARLELANSIRDELAGDRPPRRGAAVPLPLLAPAAWLRRLVHVGLPVAGAAALLAVFVLSSRRRGEAPPASEAIGAAAGEEAMAPAFARRLRAGRLGPPRLTAPPGGDGSPAWLNSELARDLHAFWPLDRTEPGPAALVARDLSPAATPCALRGPAPRPAAGDDRAGGAGGIRLDGERWLECPQPPLADGAAGEITVAARVLIRSLPPQGNRGLVTRQRYSGSRDHFFLGFNNRRISIASDSWSADIRARAPIDGRWHHLAFTRDAQEVVLYVDGTVVRRARVRNVWPAPIGAPVLIGAERNASGVNQHFDGSIADVALFSRALSPSEIATLAAPPDPSP